MSKKRSWLGLIKRLLFPETQHQQKIKRRKWLFGRLKRTKTLPSVSTPTPTPTQSKSIQITEHKTEEKQSKFEDEITKDGLEAENELPNCSEIITNDAEIITNADKITQLNSQLQIHLQTLASIKIQTAYRGYLARKALRAMKGFVRLQAIIRGRAVRRQAMTTLKCLQSIAKIQSEVCAKRCQLIRVKDDEDVHLQDLSHENPKIQLCRLRRLDDELMTKEEEIDIILRKKEAILSSKKIKAYSFNHRHSADAVLDGNSQGRLRYWLEQYVGDEISKREEKLGGKQHKLRNINDLNNLDVTTTPRKSFHKHKKQNSYSEDIIHSGSPVNLPTYMAATESAKARTRSSTSSPRLRPLHFDAYSDSDSPYKHKLFSPMSSINSEATSSGFSKVSNKCSFYSYHQKSPSFKGVSGPIRSDKNLK